MRLDRNIAPATARQLTAAHAGTSFLRRFVCASLVAIILIASATPAPAASLGPLEQIPLDSFAKLREVERYQLKIAEKYYIDENWPVAMAEYEKYLRLYEQSVAAPYAQLMWSHCLVKQRRVNTAIKDGYQSVIDYWPNSPEAVIAAYSIGKAHQLTGETRKAKKAYEKLIADHGGHITAVLAKLDLLHIAEVEQDDEGRLKILKDLTFDTKRTKENDQYCARAARDLATHLFNAGSFDEAIKALETTYQDGALLYQMYAHVRSPISRLTGEADTKDKGLAMADRAIAEIEKATPIDLSEEKDKQRAKALTYWIAEIHAYARRGSDVLKTYEKMIDLFGVDDGLLGHVAQWYRQHNQRDKARAAYAKFENQVQGQSHIAGMLREENKWDAAIAIYNDLMTLDADRADDWQWQIAECYRASNRYAEAINTYRQTDKFPSNYMMMAWCHRRLKQWNEALVLYNQSMSDEGTAPEASLQIGYTYEQAGEKEKAIRALQQVCKRFPKKGQASEAHAHLQNKYKITVTLGGATEE